MKFKKIIIIYIFLFSTLYADENNLELIKIYKNLRCLICQGQSIADSNSDFASTVKIVVQDQVKEGKSKEEIYDFLISKYGEWIVYQPTFTKNNFLLWAIPYVLLTFGGFVIYFVLRKNKPNKDN